MEIDREITDDLFAMNKKARSFVRALDTLLVPTSFVRTVMRREDDHRENSQLLQKFCGERYHPESKARWVVPVAYTAAGVLETARLAAYIYGLWTLAT